MSRFGDLEEDHDQRRQAGHVSAVAHLANREADDRERNHQQRCHDRRLRQKRQGAAEQGAEHVPPIRSSARCQVAAK